MKVNVLKSAIVLLVAVNVTACNGAWPSHDSGKNLSRFCPETTGQMAAHVCKNAVSLGKQPSAETTGNER